MELQLHLVEHDFYERVDLPVVSCETMREHIVPDSCADIARIVDASGEVCLISRDMMSDGRYSVSGTVEVAVLYIPEKESGPCALHCQIPFQYSGEGQEALDHFDVPVCLQSVDSRVLNPRKVLTRVDLQLHPRGCRKRRLSLCGSSGQDDSHLQLLRQTCETKVIAAVREKECSFAEELPLPSGRESAVEILRTRAAIRCADCKIIGNKVVVKGMLSAHILYRTENGSLERLQQELPFSQILEGSGMEESWECVGSGQLLSMECSIGSDGNRGDGRILTLAVQMRCRVEIWRNEKLELTADLYSTDAPVRTRMEEIVLQQGGQRQSRRISARELLETGVAVNTILDTSVRCGRFVRMPGTERLELPVHAHCLYLDENDMLHSVERSVRLECPVETGERDHISGWGECHGELMASILPEGIELRFPVDCTVESSRPEHYLCVAAIEAGEEGETAAAPSLVLRKVDRQESLWSVAKQYRTTCRAILEVNDIESEQQLPRDRLLLIPRSRV